MATASLPSVSVDVPIVSYLNDITVILYIGVGSHQGSGKEKEGDGFPSLLLINDLLRDNINQNKITMHE